MILNRYFLKETILYTASVSIIFLLIIVSSRSIQYLEQAAIGEIDPAVVGWVILYRLPEFIQIILPMSFFLSLVITLGRLSADNELSVFEQIGFSEKKLISISLVPATVVSVISLILSIWVAPMGSVQAERLLEKQSFEDTFNSIQPGKFSKLNNDLMFYMKERAGDSLEFVFIKFSGANGNLSDGVILAKKASVGSNKDILILKDGSVYFDRKDEESSKLNFGQLEIDITSPSGEVLTVTRLEEDLKNSANDQWNISLALISLIGVLLAVPIGKVKPRKGRYSRILPAVIIFILYIGLLVAGRGWMESGNLSATPGLYFIHLIFISLGFLLLYRNKLRSKLP